MKQFFLSDEQISHMKTVFKEEMAKGLSKDPSVRKSGSLLMENSYVTEIPDGTGY